ncbi:hypothetical protein HBB16_03050 [Pseudonocardia sp. MCCB 268]|nr:hypothetical protein [Pseudonocardia cytotoxica]
MKRAPVGIHHRYPSGTVALRGVISTSTRPSPRCCAAGIGRRQVDTAADRRGRADPDRRRGRGPARRRRLPGFDRFPALFGCPAALARPLRPDPWPRPDDAAERADALLTELGWSGDDDEPMAEFSRATRAEDRLRPGAGLRPDVLILDEPWSADDDVADALHWAAGCAHRRDLVTDPSPHRDRASAAGRAGPPAARGLVATAADLSPSCRRPPPPPGALDADRWPVDPGRCWSGSSRRVMRAPHRAGSPSGTRPRATLGWRPRSPPGARSARSGRCARRRTPAGSRCRIGPLPGRGAGAVRTARAAVAGGDAARRGRRALREVRRAGRALRRGCLRSCSAAPGPLPEPWAASRAAALPGRCSHWRTRSPRRDDTASPVTLSAAGGLLPVAAGAAGRDGRRGARPGCRQFGGGRGLGTATTGGLLDGSSHHLACGITGAAVGSVFARRCSARGGAVP